MEDCRAPFSAAYQCEVFMSTVSAKSRILTFLSKTEGYNTLSVAQAQSRFGIKNVSSVIAQLRAEGYAIYTNMKRRGDGSQVAVYRLGRPSQSFASHCTERGVAVKGAN
jgi:predicted transcriptional regulator